MARISFAAVGLVLLFGTTRAAEGALRSAVTPQWEIVVESSGGLDVLSSSRPHPRALVSHGRSYRLHDRTPTVSPDGHWVAFARSGSRRSGLYVLDLVGGRPQQLASGSIDAIAWSPDGTHIAFSRGWGSRFSGIYVVDSRGGPVKRVFPAGGFPAWAPDGRRLLCSCRGGLAIWVFDADGARPRRLTRPIGEKTGASWSPDGHLIAFGRRCHSNGRDTICDLAVMSADGRNMRTVFRSGGRRGNFFPPFAPVWSSTRTLLLPIWRPGHAIVTLDVRTGARRTFYPWLGSIHASARLTAFASVYDNRLVLLDPSGRVLARRALAIDAFGREGLGELDLHLG